MTTYEVAGRSTVGARRWVRGQLSSWPPASIDRVESVVGELVANALEHGSPPVTVLLERTSPTDPIRLTVSDRGAGPDHELGPPQRSGLVDARERGRGLRLVQALGAVINSTSDERGYRVAIELAPLGPAG